MAGRRLLSPTFYCVVVSVAVSALKAGIPIADLRCCLSSQRDRSVTFTRGCDPIQRVRVGLALSRCVQRKSKCRQAVCALASARFCASFSNRRHMPDSCCASVVLSSSVTPRRDNTTMSTAGKRCWRRRIDSRVRRFSRLRSTARFMFLRLNTRPTRTCPQLFGHASAKSPFP